MGPKIQIKKQRTRARALWLATNEMTSLTLSLSLSPPRKWNSHALCQLRKRFSVQSTTCSQRSTIYSKRVRICNPYQSRFWGQLDVAFKGHWQLGTRSRRLRRVTVGSRLSLSAGFSVLSAAQLVSVTEVKSSNGFMGYMVTWQMKIHLI